MDKIKFFNPHSKGGNTYRIHDNIVVSYGRELSKEEIEIIDRIQEDKKYRDQLIEEIRGYPTMKQKLEETVQQAAQEISRKLSQK